MTAVSQTSRDPWLDNVKTVLITCVVIGHAWGLLEGTDGTHWAYDFLYLWHIPAFVFISGYLIQDTISDPQPAPPERERAIWYQYYFNTERGRRGLDANRRSLCRLLWETWSPTWKFDEATFERSAAAFDSPDFVDVVIQSYRHRFGYAPGDPALEAIEQRLAVKPRIPVPTIVLHGDGSGLSQPESSVAHRPLFTGPYQHRVIPVAGHNLPQETPKAVADAVLELVQATA